MPGQSHSSAPLRRTALSLLVIALVAVAFDGGVPSIIAQTPSVPVKVEPPTKYAGRVPVASFSEAAVDADLALGDDAARERRSQGFTVPADGTAGCIRLWLSEVGNPADKLTLEIQTDSGGLPSGTVVTNGTSTAVSGLSYVMNSYRWVTFRFSPAPSLTAATQYHLVLNRAGLPDASNYYVWGGDESSPSYTDGAAAVYDGSSWGLVSPDTDHAFDILSMACFGVDIRVEGLTTELGAYAAGITYDPTVVEAQSIVNGPFLASTGRSVGCISEGLGDTNWDAVADTIQITCATLGASPAGPTGAGVLATVYFAPVGFGDSDLDLLEYPGTLLIDISANRIEHGTLGGGAVVQTIGDGDSDGDGCHDVEEAGDDPMLGGDRNWLDAFDFYDVPVPANADPTPNGTRDKTISIGDVLAVLFYNGATDDGPPNGSGVDYDSDKDADTVEDGTDYDRTPASPWSGPPDDVINMGDVLAVLEQNGHSCTGSPS